MGIWAIAVVNWAAGVLIGVGNKGKRGLETMAEGLLSKRPVFLVILAYDFGSRDLIFKSRNICLPTSQSLWNVR